MYQKSFIPEGARYVRLRLESYRKFQFQRFNFLFVEVDDVQSHRRWKRTKRPSQMMSLSEDAEEEIFLTFKWKQYINNSEAVHGRA